MYDDEGSELQASSTHLQNSYWTTVGEEWLAENSGALALWPILDAGVSIGPRLVKRSSATQRDIEGMHVENRM